MGTKVDNVLSGGAASDVLKGYDGSDRMIRGLGNDSYLGGAGSDTFVFSINANDGGKDVFRDYTAGEDRIDLTGVSAVADYAALRGLMSESGGNVLVNFGGGHALKISATTITTLDAHQTDFLFHL